jgi:hypothetical protein
MRLWSNVAVIIGKDLEGPSLLMQGKLENNITLSSVNWEVENPLDETCRVWRFKNAKEIKFIAHEADEDQYSFLQKKIERTKPLNIHPAFTSGFEHEAIRLYPEISEKSRKEFVEIVQYLKTSYDLKQSVDPTDNLTTFVDGFGPGLLLQVDNNIEILPEIPPTYPCPDNWTLISYFISTSMFGPNMDVHLSPKASWYFNDNFQPENRAEEALVYFEAARSLVTWAAWEKDPSTRFLSRLHQLILSGYRPLMDS